jgi:creatinine amidohydrolase
MPSKYWSDWTSPEFSQIDPSRAVAVVPLGATEQHGPHLPLGVDTLIVNALVEGALKLLADTDPVLVLPTQEIGLSPEHSAFAGTLTESAESVMRSWSALGACVAKAGVKKLLFFNAHGGHQGLMEVVARELRLREELIVFSSSWYQLPMPQAVKELFTPDEHRFGVHGGAMETSLMMSIAPHLVRTREIQNFESRSKDRATRYAVLGNGHSAKLGWHAQDYNVAGAMGDATQASKDKGDQLLFHATRGLKAMLLELMDLPLETIHTL